MEILEVIAGEQAAWRWKPALVDRLIRRILFDNYRVDVQTCSLDLLYL